MPKLRISSVFPGLLGVALKSTWPWVKRKVQRKVSQAMLAEAAGPLQQVGGTGKVIVVPRAVSVGYGVEVRRITFAHCCKRRIRSFGATKDSLGRPRSHGVTGADAGLDR